MKMKKRSRVLSAFIPQQFTRAIRALADPALAGITILAMTANAFDEDKKKHWNAAWMDSYPNR